MIIMCPRGDLNTLAEWLLTCGFASAQVSGGAWGGTEGAESTQTSFRAANGSTEPGAEGRRSPRVSAGISGYAARIHRAVAQGRERGESRVVPMARGEAAGRVLARRLGGIVRAGAPTAVPLWPASKSMLSLDTLRLDPAIDMLLTRTGLHLDPGPTHRPQRLSLIVNTTSERRCSRLRSFQTSTY